MKMPDRIDLGQNMAATVGHAIKMYSSFRANPGKYGTDRSVMGFRLPKWQRGIVWDEERQIKFVESLWLGIPVGTYTYNIAYGSNEGEVHPLSNLLVDGQQRMMSLQRYLDDEIEVFGARYSQLTLEDAHRLEDGRSFPCYRVETEDDGYLRGYYDLMNFGGIAHKPEDRADPDGRFETALKRR